MSSHARKHPSASATAMWPGSRACRLLEQMCRCQLSWPATGCWLLLAVCAAKVMVHLLSKHRSCITTFGRRPCSPSVVTMALHAIAALPSCHGRCVFLCAPSALCCMQVQFRARGPTGSGLVGADMFKDSNKKWQYSFLFIDLDAPLQHRLHLEGPGP